MKFLRELLAVIVGIFISVFLMLMVFMVIGVVAGGSGEEISVKKNSVLVFKLDKNIKDYAPESPDPIMKLLEIDPPNLGLNEMINAIKNAKNDDNIKGISLEALSIKAGIAQMQELRDALADFKESGKFIISYADFYTQKNYYLSSVADSIYVNPVGGIDFRGLGGEILYFKDFQDKYGIRMEVIRHGKYKSAVEPFLRNSMSEENREQTRSFLNSIWSDMLMDIGYSRNKTTDELNRIADSLLVRKPELAVARNFITGPAYFDEYRDMIRKLTGVKEEGKLNLISLKDYIKSGKGKIKSKSKDRIAVLYAQGEIIYGEGDKDIIGQKMILKAMEKIRKDKKIKAVVLRVNSPGGSGLASDIIWRGIEKLKEKKPVVVSMGNYAASGGYYISCNADKIFAEPTTITGSIGVFGIVPNVHDFSDRIGINAEQVGTNEQSVDYSIFEPMSKTFYRVTKEEIEDFYKTFVGKVAEGRHKTFAEIDSIAQGRVWTGAQAKALGLVDELGSLDDAVEAAASLAGIDSYSVKNYPRYKDDFKKALNAIPFIKVDLESAVSDEIGAENYKAYKQVKDLMQLKGIQARMPFVIEIR